MKKYMFLLLFAALALVGCQTKDMTEPEPQEYEVSINLSGIPVSVTETPLTKSSTPTSGQVNLYVEYSTDGINYHPYADGHLDASKSISIKLTSGLKYNFKAQYFPEMRYEITVNEFRYHTRDVFDEDCLENMFIQSYYAQILNYSPSSSNISLNFERSYFGIKLNATSVTAEKPIILALGDAYPQGDSMWLSSGDIVYYSLPVSLASKKLAVRIINDDRVYAGENNFKVGYLYTYNIDFDKLNNADGGFGITIEDGDLNDGGTIDIGIQSGTTIKYTSTDGNTVAPYSLSATDASGKALSIASNTYTNGVGTITLNGIADKMDFSFNGCTTLKTFDGISNVVQLSTAEYMFKGCKYLEHADLGKIKANIKSIRGMFYNCIKLKSINFYYDTDSDIPRRSSWSYISDARDAFRNCYVLQSLDIRPFYFSSYVSGSYTFANCKALEKIYVNGTASNFGLFTSTFTNIKKNGVLLVPAVDPGSNDLGYGTGDYDFNAWLSNSQYFLGYYGWKCEEYGSSEYAESYY